MAVKRDKLILQMEKQQRDFFRKIKDLKRLRALCENPAFENWYYHNFFTHGIAPVSPSGAKRDMKRYREALDLAIEELEEWEASDL